MVELLIFFALLGWGVVATLEFLATLDAFPTIVAAAVCVPVIVAISIENALTRADLQFLKTKRKFLPPERFYWPSQAKKLRFHMVVFFSLALVSWPFAIWFPAALDVSSSSLIGWASGLVGITCLALATSNAWIFLKGSQRFDRLTPWAVGSVRRFMFWVSDNHEFLGEEPEQPRKKPKESIY